MADDKKIIFSMVGVSKIYPPQKQVLKNIYLSFYYGAKIGILGLNGAGKSTLLKIIAGLEKSYNGEVVFSPGYTVGYLSQEPDFDHSKTAREIVMEGAQKVVDLLKEFEEINNKFAEPMSDDAMNKLIERQGVVQDAIDSAGGWEIDNKIEIAMDALRCPDPEAKIENLSGGEKRRIALCRLLLQEPDILLLDEPTNHLDAESVLWLEQHLQQYKGTVIAVTHDRYFLDNVAGWILELDHGHGIPWKGNYSSWLEQKQERVRREEKADSKRQKTLEHELEWIRMSPKARMAKGKARVTAYESLLNQESDQRREDLEIYIPPGPRLGDMVIDFHHIAKAYGDRMLIEDLDFSIPPGSIVGVIGPNGAGKSTMLRMIVGAEKPDSGSVTIGDTVKLAYVEQLRDTLDGDRSVWQEITEGNEII